MIISKEDVLVDEIDYWTIDTLEFGAEVFFCLLKDPDSNGYFFGDELKLVFSIFYFVFQHFLIHISR